MTEERDPEVSAAYRGLGAQEPPRALDDAILAAARRDAGARPAALGARASRQRWYAPLATAAVLVLAVATTLNMRLEKPGIESPAPQKLEVEAKPDATVATRDKDAVKPQSIDEVRNVQRKFKEQSAPVVATAPAVSAAPAAPEPKPFAADQAAAAASPRSDESAGVASVTGKLAAQSGEVQALAKRAEEDARSQTQQRQVPMAQSAPPAAAARPAPAPMRERVVALTPEQELERIADLRRQQKHDDADKALAEFRKRHPDYRIPEATLLRVERR